MATKQSPVHKAGRQKGKTLQLLEKPESLSLHNRERQAPAASCKEPSFYTGSSRLLVAVPFTIPSKPTRAQILTYYTQRDGTPPHGAPRPRARRQPTPDPRSAGPSSHVSHCSQSPERHAIASPILQTKTQHIRKEGRPGGWALSDQPTMHRPQTQTPRRHATSGTVLSLTHTDTDTDTHADTHADTHTHTHNYTPSPPTPRPAPQPLARLNHPVRLAARPQASRHRVRRRQVVPFARCCLPPS